MRVEVVLEFVGEGERLGLVMWNERASGREKRLLRRRDCGEFKMRFVVEVEMSIIFNRDSLITRWMGGWLDR